MGLAPNSIELLDGVLGHVTRAGHQGRLPLHAVVASGQHFLGEIDAAVAGGFGPQQRSAVFEPLARQHAAESIHDPFVLAEQKADLPAAHSDVTGRHVRVRTDMPVQLGHERLAESHDFVIALALGVEVGSAFAAPHGERGQRVLEHLFESEELEHAERDGRVEPQATFIRTDRAVHLDAETAVDLDLAPIVDPRDAEHDDAFRLHQPLQDPRLPIHGVGIDERHHRFDDLANRLVELNFPRVLGGDLVHEFIDAGGSGMTGVSRHGG